MAVCQCTEGGWKRLFQRRGARSTVVSLSPVKTMWLKVINSLGKNNEM